MQADGNIIIDTKIDSSGISDGTKRIKDTLEKDQRGIKKTVGEVENSLSRLGNVAKKVGAAVAAAFAAKQIIQFGKECLELGSDLQEVQNVVDVSFPTMKEQVNDFAKSAAASFGLSETMAKRYAGTFGSMAKAFGYTENEAYNMASALTGLTGDVASFYNITQDEAYTKLKSVFTGETESLKELGVVMTENALNQYALANGYGKTTAKMSEQEKVALRLRFVQTQLSSASGDFMRTSDSWANQVRVFQLQLESLKATIGQGFINLFTPLIKAFNVFIGKVTEAATAFKNFTEAVMGKQTSSQSGELGEIQNGYEGAAEGAEDFSESVKEAGKEAKKALAPFDDLIILQRKEEDAGNKVPIGSMSGDSSLIPKVEKDAELTFLNGINERMDAIKSRLLEMKDIFTSGFWEGLGDYKPILNEISKDFQSIKDHLKSIFTDAEVMESANRMVNAFVDMAGKMAGAMVSVGLTIAANLIGGFESYLSNNTERIKEWLITVFDVTSEIYTLWGDFFVAFADVFSVFASQTAQDITGLIIQIFSDLFMGFTELVAKFTRDVTDLFLSPFIENKDRIKTAIENTLNPIKTIIEGIASVVRNVVDGVIALYDTHIHPLFMTLKDEVSNFLEILLDGYNSYIAPVLDKVAKKFKEVMEGKVGDAINSALRFIGKLVDFIRLCWEQVVFPIINWIAEKMLPFISPALEAIGNVVIDVLGTIADVIGSVFDVLSGLIDFITGVFTGNWEAAWQGVKDIFAGIWDGIVSVIEGAVKIIEGIIDGIKGTIDAVFGTDFSDSDSISGRTRRYESYPASVYAAVPYKMPRLATGTVVPPRAGEFAAILGDNKRETEVVSPLSTMKQALKEALSESGFGAGERDINIELVLDGQRFARAVYKANNQEKQRVGVRMVTNG